jgi:hypothetical protein
MKIGGKTPGVNRGVIEFHRPGGLFRLVVQAVPYGFPERLEREIPAPEPPVDFARDPKTGAAVRDEFGMAVKVERKSDPGYQRELGRVRALRVVAHVREALRGDPGIRFEADEQPEQSGAVRKPASGRAYAEAVEQEFAEAGIADAEILAIFGKSIELSRGTAQRVDEAAERFLSVVQDSAPAGKSPTAPDEAGST